MYEFLANTRVTDFLLNLLAGLVVALIYDGLKNLLLARKQHIPRSQVRKSYSRGLPTPEIAWGARWSPKPHEGLSRLLLIVAWLVAVAISFVGWLYLPELLGSISAGRDEGRVGGFIGTLSIVTMNAVLLTHLLRLECAGKTGFDWLSWVWGRFADMRAKLSELYWTATGAVIGMATMTIMLEIHWYDWLAAWRWIKW